MKSILFVAAEGLPFIKSGGLADVIGSLPKALLKKGHDVKVVLPLYKKMAEKNHHEFEYVCSYSVGINYEEVSVNIYKQDVNGVMFYFVENQKYFERDELYGYDDDGERFAYFQKAVLEMLNQLDYFPDVIHCHDWHTGMLATMCKENFEHDERYRRIQHVYTIHNLAYQGNFGQGMLDSCLGLDNYLYECGAVRYDTGISFMKSAIVYSDRVSTVSPTYSQEILTSEYGEHLEHVLQMRYADLGGILNGIDVDEWNPAKDSELVKNFNKVSVFKGKAENKLALQQRFGLEEDPDVMLVGMVTRLTSQKGLQLVLDQMGNMLKAHMQVVLLGSGDKGMEAAFDAIASANSGKFGFYRGYNEALAHQIYASCDCFLMPSKFEPCGLSQMISLRYGTLPIVRETGGLKDSVLPYNEFTKEGTGFTFTQYDSHDMMSAIHRALYVYYEEKTDFKKLIKQAMKFDVSWDKSAQDYSNMYEYL